MTLNGGEGRKPVLSAPVVLDAFHTDMGLVDVMDLSQWLAKFAVFLRSNDLQHFNEAFFESNIQPVVGTQERLDWTCPLSFVLRLVFLKEKKKKKKKKKKEFMLRIVFFLSKCRALSLRLLLECCVWELTVLSH